MLGHWIQTMWQVHSARLYVYIFVILRFVLKVAQYIKFELPVLQSFIAKLQEEEEREMQKLKKRYRLSHT